MNDPSMQAGPLSEVLPLFKPRPQMAAPPRPHGSTLSAADGRALQLTLRPKDGSTRPPCPDEPEDCPFSESCPPCPLHRQYNEEQEPPPPTTTTNKEPPPR